MKNLTLIFVLLAHFCLAQKTVINFTIKNSSDKEVYILRGNYADAEVLFGGYYETLTLKDGKTSYTPAISKPTFLTLNYLRDSTGNSLQYNFFVSPGDQLNFSVDALKPDSSIVVTGVGANNNHPDIQTLKVLWPKLGGHKQDSLPSEIWNIIKHRSQLNQKILQAYIDTHKPTKEFISAYSLCVKYYPTWLYVQLKGSQKFYARKAYYRNEEVWQQLEDSLVNATPLSRPELLNIPTHAYFLSNYLLRLKERIWHEPALAKNYELPGQTVGILQIDGENLLREKIIEKHFSGNTAEFLYAVIFKESIGEKEDSLPEIFKRFKENYPKSQYTAFIEPQVQKMIERSKRKLTSDMKFEDSKSYSTFGDVLKLIKGKTVLLDMWGTWCGPCRQELLANSDSIKLHFKGRPVEFLYIANHDSGKDAKWKELIAYYKLTGTHILASEDLTRDIMKNIQGEGYPTYVIIKRDGTYELSKAGYPMKREVLIEQIENALKE